MGTPLSEWDPIAGGGANPRIEEVCQDSLTPKRPLTQALGYVGLATLAWATRKSLGIKPKDGQRHFQTWQEDKVRRPLLVTLLTCQLVDLVMVTSFNQFKDDLMIYVISSVQTVTLIVLPHQRWRQVSVQMHSFVLDQLWVILAALAYPSLVGRIGAAHVTNYFIFRQLI